MLALLLSPDAIMRASGTSSYFVHSRAFEEGSLHTAFMDDSTPFFIFCLLKQVDRKSNVMSKNILRSTANLLIATAVIFFLYGLVHIIVELPAHERLRAIATVIVVSVVVGALFWVVGTTRPKV